MPALPSFVNLLTRDRVAVSVEASSKADVIERCARHLGDSGHVLDARQLAVDLRAREAKLSTGVGDGVALPHARTAAVTGTVAALATLRTPVDWQAIDGEPVDLVVLFAGPDTDRSAYVRLLAQVSRVLSATGVRHRLAAAQTPDEAIAALREAERSVAT